MSLPDIPGISNDGPRPSIVEKRMRFRTSAVVKVYLSRNGLGNQAFVQGTSGNIYQVSGNGGV
jgi:hypothetical protein